MIVVTISPNNRLWLTEVETSRLAEQIRQELVCRTAAEANDLVLVADIAVTAAEAWQTSGQSGRLAGRRDR